MQIFSFAEEHLCIHLKQSFTSPCIYITTLNLNLKIETDEAWHEKAELPSLTALTRLISFGLRKNAKPSGSDKFFPCKKIPGKIQHEGNTAVKYWHGKPRSSMNKNQFCFPMRLTFAKEENT